ncbi:MAG: hypothetical protein KDA41_13480 [Planctomycetales bacterium]|nr:hypothetical protein [Planctomycetales bacterium]
MTLQRAARLLVIVLIFVSAWSHAPARAEAQIGADQVQTALDALTDWLASSPRGDGWHEFLHTAALRAELAKGDAADVDALRKNLDYYKTGGAAVTKRRFQDVAMALAGWIDELSMPKAEALPELAAAAVADIKPLPPEGLAQSKSKLQSALNSLDRFLQSGGKEKEEGWKEFLYFENLKSQLDAEEPNIDALTQTWSMFSEDQPGLANAHFTAARDALLEHLLLVEAQKQGEGLLASLPDKLTAYTKGANEQSTADLGSVLGWLEKTNQAKDAVDGIRRRYALPNLHVNASQRLAVYGFSDKVDETQPISRYQDGNTVRGTGHTTADVMGELVPNFQRAEVLLSMKGAADTNTRTFASNNVTIDATGHTDIDAGKPIYLTQKGFETDPAWANCETKNKVNRVSAPSGQVQQIAQQRVAESHHSNELRAARDAEQQVRRDLDSRVRTQLAEANQDLTDSLFGPLRRRGAELRQFQTFSSVQSLAAKMTLAAREHLAAPDRAPKFDATGDLVAQLHTSALVNWGDIMMRGYLLTDVDVERILKERGDEVPEELQVTEDSDPWNITFASRRPLWIELGDDQFTITLRGVRFLARNRVMEEPMHITAKYKVVRKDGVKLVRTGDVAVTFPDQGDKLGVRYLTLRTFWESKFAAMFQPQYDDLSIKLDGAWEAAGPLSLTALSTSKSGWIGAAWDMAPAAEPPAEATEKPAEAP